MAIVVNDLRAALVERYRIERELGAGGMATVYLAHDTRHDRKVAIKVLKPELAAVLGAERFVVEIKTTASLQHPHILPLFDSGSADGFLYYVMPFIEGETIREKLNRETQFGVDDAIRIAREVADALDYAHRHGVIHRDIKPENILLHDGRAMVMDFGIALAVSAAAGGRMTETGLSLGTPHYMSPEQATADKEITPRSDIYSLASVLYEMLAGQPPHLGGAAQQVIMKIITEQAAPVTSLRKSVPPNVSAALAKALEKLPADRFESSKAFAEALITPGFRATFTTTAAPQPRRSRAIVPWAIAGASLALAGAVAWRATSTDSAPRPPVFASLDLENVGLTGPNASNFSVSPDGRNVVLVVDRTDNIGLAVRALDSVGVRYLPRTGRASHPFWSPDGKSIGFFADDSLKTIELASGVVRTKCFSGGSHGGAWSSDDVIIFSAGRDLGKTSARGSECGTLLLNVVDLNRTLRPYFFPDGRHFVATGDRHAWLGELGQDSLALLVSLDRGEAVFVAPDYLLWNASNGVLAQRIDVRAKRLVGEPVRIMPRVAGGGGHTAISASATGLLLRSRIRDVVVADTADASGITLVDRASSATQFRLIGTGVWGALRYSRDGQRLGLSGWNIQAMDVASGRWARMAGSAETGRETAAPVLWAPGDTALLYVRGSTPPVVAVTSLRTGTSRGITLIKLGGVVPVRGASALSDWSPDGRRIALAAARPGQPPDAWEYDFVADTLISLFDATAEVSYLRYAPTGGWISYELTDGAETEVYVRPYPGPGEEIRVSSGGGTRPSWSATGAELYYVSRAGDVMSVSIQGGTPPKISAPRVVVARSVFAPRQIDQFDVAPNGQQFAVILRSETRTLSLVLNWEGLLRKPLP